MSGRRLPCFGHLHAVRCRFVAGDAFVEGLCDLLAIGFALQIAFVGRAADEGNFGENRWHGRAGQNKELGRLDAAVADARAVRCQSRVESALNARGETPRLVDLFVQFSGG